VLDSVLQQLCDDDCQWVATSAPRSPMSPVVRTSTSTGVRTRVAGKADEGRHDLVEVQPAPPALAPRSRGRARSPGSSAPPRRAHLVPNGPPPGETADANSDEMVCRLFFTRWCTSRIAASFERSNRSRRRRSVTSRSKSTAPVSFWLSISGMQRTSTIASLRRSISSIVGRRFAKADSTACVSIPSSGRLEPTIADTMPDTVQCVRRVR